MKGLDIKIARIKSGLKQYKVAAVLGIPQTTLCDIENGKQVASPELLEKILSVIHESKTL